MYVVLFLGNHDQVSLNAPSSFLFPLYESHIANDLTFSEQAEGLTAIEAWVIVCVLFVFGALVGNLPILSLLFGKCTNTYYCDYFDLH